MTTYARYGFVRNRGYVIVCVLFIILPALGACGGGSGESGDEDLLKSLLQLRGVNGDGTDTSPIPDATCRLVNFAAEPILNPDQQPITDITDADGRFELNGVPLDIEGFIECAPPGFPDLVLDTFVSTVGAVGGEIRPDEDVLPQTTVVANIIREFDAAIPNPDLVTIKADLQQEIAADPVSNTAQVAQAAVVLFNNMRDGGVTGIRFSNLRLMVAPGALEDLLDDGFLDDAIWNGAVRDAVQQQTESTIAAELPDLTTASSQGSLTGQVVNTAGLFLQDVDVIAVQPGQLNQLAVTDGQGIFLFDDLPAGPTQVFVAGRLVTETVVIGAAEVDLGLLQVNTAAAAFGTIDGQVVNQNGAGLEDTSMVARQNGQVVAGPVTSGANGLFTLTNVPVGAILVTTETGTSTNGDQVTVLEGQTIQALVVVQVVF